MRPRVLLLIVLVLSVLAAGGPPAFATGASPDGHILRQATARLGHTSRSQVIRWLRARRAVLSARLGRDGRTIDVHFRDGQEMLILPARLSRVRLPALHPVRVLTPYARALQSASPRAAVLEPFATELGMGGNAGDPEVGVLQQAGFRVDTGYDQAVSVSFMTSLASYNVVYMHTHSGVTASGDGVLATGQIANNDASVGSYLADGSVTTVGVAGDNTNLYYALTSRFFAAHVGTFAPASILFFNGCKLLPSTTFWNALAARGAGVMLSWTDDATSQDDYLSAAALFNFLGQGQSVNSALQSTVAAGYGKSTYQGATATLGFHGDGSISLSRAAQGRGQQPTPTSVPTATPRPTDTPRPTSIATPTSTTPAPTSTTVAPTSTATTVPLAIDHLLSQVVPGKKQTVSVRTAAGVAVTADVLLPNGTTRTHSASANGSGIATLSFSQPASTILRSNRTATVTVRPSAGSSGQEIKGSYTIGYGPIDLAVKSAQRLGSSVTIWVHTHARSQVTLGIQFQGTRNKALHGSAGSAGWARFVYKVPKGATTGESVNLTAATRYGGKAHTTRAGFHFA